MLHLLQWLDFGKIFGGKQAFVSFAAIALLIFGVLGQSRIDTTVVTNTAEIPAHFEIPAQFESLFTPASVELAPEVFSEARHCLAQAIYFEARSEPIAGWEAVADVVINRTLDRRYPSTICGVVFQGEYNRHSCQFSFACDGLSDRARNRKLWKKALEIAGTKLVESRERSHTANATHYHADYVTPYWSEKMVRLTKIGRHIFYTDRQLMKF